MVLPSSKYRKTRAKKLVDAMQNTQPVTETELKASGIIGASETKSKRVRVKKVLQRGDFNDVLNKVKGVAATVGDVLKTAATAAPYVLPLVGLGKEKKPNEWNAIVAKVRHEQGLTLKDVMKYVKSKSL